MRNDLPIIGLVSMFQASNLRNHVMLVQARDQAELCNNSLHRDKTVCTADCIRKRRRGAGVEKNEFDCGLFASGPADILWSVFSFDAGRTSDLNTAGVPGPVTRTLLGSQKSSPVMSVNINTTLINFHLFSEQRDRLKVKSSLPCFLS